MIIVLSLQESEKCQTFTKTGRKWTDAQPLGLINISPSKCLFHMLTDRCVDLDECNVRSLVHIFDFGIIGAATLQLHFHPVLIGHNVGIGHNLAIFWHNKARTAGHCHLPLGVSHPVRGEWEGGRRRRELGYHYPLSKTFIFQKHTAESSKLNTWTGVEDLKAESKQSVGVWAGGKYMKIVL